MTTEDLFTRTHGKTKPFIHAFTKEDMIKFGDARMAIAKDMGIAEGQLKLAMTELKELKNGDMQLAFDYVGYALHLVGAFNKAREIEKKRIK